MFNTLTSCIMFYDTTYIHTMYIHTYNVHTYIHTYMYTYKCTYMHPYIHTYVAVLGSITLCVFQSRYQVQSVVAQNIHKQWSHMHLCRPVRYSCIYAVRMSPAINGSSAPQRSEHSNTEVLHHSAPNIITQSKFDF